MPILSNEPKTRFFHAGDRLPQTKDYLWSIVDGVVKTYSLSEARVSVTLGFWGAEDLVGKSLSNLNSYQIRCISNVRAIAIPQTQWSSLSTKLIYHQQQTQQLMYIIRNHKMNSSFTILT